MASEWNCLKNYTRTKSVTVADANAIAKGTLLILSSDPNTATVHGTDVGSIPIGVTLEDKVASDGKTSMSVALDGEWDVVANGAIVLGYPVICGAVANTVKQVHQSMISLEYIRCIMGTCMETASDTERVRIGLNLPG
jgi:hypothetical protein